MTTGWVKIPPPLFFIALFLGRTHSDEEEKQGEMAFFRILSTPFLWMKKVSHQGGKLRLVRAQCAGIPQIVNRKSQITNGLCYVMYR